MNNDKRKKTWSGTKARGYYIALGLCAIAIAIAGLVYYQSPEEVPAVKEDTVPIHVTAKEPQQDFISVIGTEPKDDTTAPPTDPTRPMETQPKPIRTMWPIEGEVVAVFAADKLTYNQTTQDWRVHHGIDLSAQEGAEVKAAADGTVYAVYTDQVMGTTVVIQHEGGYMTTYASLSEEVTVTEGQQVMMGQVIGTVGQSCLTEKALGPHVHFSVTCNDVLVDPESFLTGV